MSFKSASPFALLLWLLSGCAAADGGSAGISSYSFEGSDWTVYENFTVGGQTDASGGLHSLKIASASPAYIGAFGDEPVFSSGTRTVHDDGRIAFVKEGDKAFMLDGRITFRCQRGTDDCVPEGIEAEKLADGIFAVNASSFEQWREVYRKLSSDPGIRKCSISRDFGRRLKLN
ncbi:MAG: hypothetical protein IJ523_05275 [Succinivibrionaceae bacterium]|nr:hypothetical protein [Succinivibrionaceae bacterium]